MVAGLLPVLRSLGWRPRRALPFVAALSIVVGVGACGSDEGESADSGSSGQSAEAQRGRELAEDSGCVGCHRAGGGGIGPDWEGLYGSTVTLDDGSTVVADLDYLTLAITDPDAQIVEGFDVKMPAREVDEDDVAAIVAYIRELAPANTVTTS